MILYAPQQCCSSKMDAILSNHVKHHGSKRHRALATAHVEKGAASTLVQGETESWALSGKYASDCIDTMKRTKIDHGNVTHLDVARLARTQSRGNSSRTMRRQTDTLDRPPISMIKTKVFDIKRRPMASVIDHDVPMVEPHWFMHWLYSADKAVFNRCVRGNVSEPRMAELWESLLEDDPVRKNIVGGDYGLMSMAVLYGDGVPVAQEASKMSLNVVATHPCLGIGSSWDTYWLNWAIPDTLTHKKEPRGNWTSKPLYKQYLHSMDACATGIFPEFDANNDEHPVGSLDAEYAGTYIADGECLVLARSIGDLDWGEKQLETTCHSSLQCCDKCPANRTTQPWSDVRPDATWKPNLYSADD